MTDDFLIRHAIRNVWPAPGQDIPAIIAPRRISQKGGVRGAMSVLRTRTTMPNTTNWFHVYQIGSLTPSLIGMRTEFNTWIRLDAQANAHNNLIDVYTKKGRMIPRARVWSLFTRDNNLIMAVLDDRTVVDLDVEDVFFKFYSNAYFKQPENQGDDDGIRLDSRLLTSQNDILLFQAQWRAHRERKGFAYAFVDGYRVYELNTSTLRIGVYAEFVWDSSIVKRVLLPAGELKKYLSTLDSKEKYLLHYEADVDQSIVQRYCDDVDVYLLRFTNAQVYRGIYYNKNLPDAMRMVTHRDYSIPTAYVAGYLNDNPTLATATAELTVELLVRDGGIDQYLVPENNRIEQLYDLPEERIVNAMIGMDSNLEFWKAAVLESSAYTQIMRSKFEQIGHLMVENAYGYNAISSLVAESPLMREGDQGWIKLPPALQANSTIYEYDATGRLIGWHYHQNGQYYPIRDVEGCSMIEGVVGRGGQYLSTEYTLAESVLFDSYNYRFYTCPIVGGEITYDWVDVTGEDDYVVEDGVATWLVDNRVTYTAVKSDAEFVAYTLMLDYLNQVLRFTVNVSETRSNGIADLGPMSITPAIIEVWLNGKSIIRDIDFYVKWPEICIVNKEYLIEGVEQRIDIRARGFGKVGPTKRLELETFVDYGFISHSMLSVNKQYDLRDGKVVRIVADGAVYHRSALSFAEDGVAVEIKGPRNGAPYQVTDPPISIKRVSTQDSYVLRDASKVIDKQVEDYLTLYRPDLPELGPNPIPGKYAVYSPFVGKIIYDFVNGLLADDDIQGHYNDTLIREKLAIYEWLLEYEPTYRDVDTSYVSVHPHNRTTVIVLGVYQYIFVQRAVKLYLDNKVDITRFLAIEPGYEHYTPDHPHPYRVLP